MLRKLLAALALFSFAGVAYAGDKPLYAPAPAWVKPAPPIDATHLTDADPLLLMVDQQQKLQDGDVWAYADTATRIATPQMLTQAGTLQIPWDPSKGDVTFHRVEIIRGAEHIDVLAGGARFNVLRREQQLEQATLNGMLTATMAVEGLRVGDVLHVSFSIDRKDSALHGHLQTVLPLLAEPLRLQFGRVRLLWPKAMNLQLRGYAHGGAQPVDAPDGFRELTVQLPLPKPSEMPDDAPLRFQPLQFLQATNYADWNDVSRDMAPLFRTEGTIAPGSPLEAEVAKIAAATSDPRTRAAMALQLVQDKVRYLFRGMDNGNYVPQAPAFTWSARYGDCKAKTLLLVALLRALKVEAEPVLVNAVVGDLVAGWLPMPAAFNHVIAHAVIGGESLWLDGTAGGARIEDLNDVPPFHHALPLREAGATLIEMPMRPAARPTTDAQIEVDATPGLHFPMPYKARITVRGQKAELMRLISAQRGKDDVNKSIDAMLTGYLGQNDAIDRNMQYDETTGTALITASGITYSNWAKDDGRYKSQLDATVDGITFAPDRARAAWRDLPVTSGIPEDKRVQMRIHLPNAGAGFTLDGDRTLPPTLGSVVLKRNVTLADGWVTLDDRVTTGITEVAPADIPAARAQVAQAKTRLLRIVAPADYPPSYQLVEPAKRAKAFDPILAAYARQIADQPDSAHSYTVRAWFLESIYDRAGAVRDLDKAIAIEPDVDTYLWRARLLTDLHQEAKAIVDAKAAIDIDPSSSAAIIQLASLEAATGKRDVAVAALAEHVAQGGKEKPDYVSAQATLVSEGGKVAEGVALLDQVITTSPGNPELLNSRCWIKGTQNMALDTALKDCTKSIELSENPAAALDSRAMVYFRMNRFDDALADLNAALTATPDLAASLYMRGVIGKRTGAKDADADLAAARMMAPRIDEEYGKFGIKP